MNGAQLEFALEPHDGTPHSFLRALRCHLDGFNPDRQQVEKQQPRPAILTALRLLRTLDCASYRAARAMFPELRPALDQWEATQESGPQPNIDLPALSSWQEPLFPCFMPTIAPSATGARGTPVSAFSAARVLQPGADAYPTSWRLSLMLPAFFAASRAMRP